MLIQCEKYFQNPFFTTFKLTKTGHFQMLLDRYEKRPPQTEPKAEYSS